MAERNNWKRKLALACCAAGLFFSASAQARELTIIYVPLDNRPVCAGYAEATMKAAGCRIIMPDEKYIASNVQNGNPEKVLEWLEKKAPKADAAVISTDSLIYGGLVGSRTHEIPDAVLEQRIKRLKDLKMSLPIKLYAFSTIMRTPRASKGRVEPPYYSSVGPTIFAYSELLDKKDQGKLAPSEALLMQALERNLPKSQLGDWLERREKNFDVNEELLKLACSNKFHYFAIGKDDNAQLSSTHMEARRLSRMTIGIPDETFQIIDGVDQLGLLLLARAYNEAKGLKPSVYPMYSEGVGPGTLPQYSDSRLQDSVPQQIIAAGGSVASSAAGADLVLALNTPDNGIVQDSTADSNKFFASPANKRFIEAIGRQLNAGSRVSLADISYSNGADNGFMNMLARTDSLDRLAAYNGWNTADNAIGYAIAQGMLSSSMPAAKISQLKKQRLIDDWYYQSNARRFISDELEKHNREDMKYDLGAAHSAILQQVTADCRKLSSSYAATEGAKFTLSFPWNRLFEVDVELEQK